ncbi:MAG: hypothetical protein P9M14_08855 [Candidatus Alcyoniella australis]|nr:hypothetical protein [Candidatus Alcyoniella australis]
MIKSRFKMHYIVLGLAFMLCFVACDTDDANDDDSINDDIDDDDDDDYDSHDANDDDSIDDDIDDDDDDDDDEEQLADYSGTLFALYDQDDYRTHFAKYTRQGWSLFPDIQLDGIYLRDIQYFSDFNKAYLVGGWPFGKSTNGKICTFQEGTINCITLDQNDARCIDCLDEDHCVVGIADDLLHPGHYYELADGGTWVDNEISDEIYMPSVYDVYLEDDGTLHIAGVYLKNYGTFGQWEPLFAEKTAEGFVLEDLSVIGDLYNMSLYKMREIDDTIWLVGGNCNYYEPGHIPDNQAGFILQQSAGGWIKEDLPEVSDSWRVLDIRKIGDELIAFGINFYNLACNGVLLHKRDGVWQNATLPQNSEDDYQYLTSLYVDQNQIAWIGGAICPIGPYSFNSYLTSYDTEAITQHMGYPSTEYVVNYIDHWGSQ